jgi:exosortase A-associated hydrolase 1
MSYDEYAFFFNCGNESLPGIISRPVDGPVPEDASAPHIGVLIIVGGPQYRVGSHRQFVLLARMLAGAGVPCMRFDCRGMGDATGSPRAFDALEEDIHAALDAFFSAEPTLTGVLLWGLCDGASAAVLYAGDDPRVDGLLLLNPWVCTEEGAARIRLRHYYLQRFFSRAFWAKFVRGDVTLVPALRELWHAFLRARGWGGDALTAMATAADGADKSLPDRMQAALQMLSIPWWVILSGQDYVAREFELVAASPAWSELFPARAAYRLPDADHTFSSALWRDEVANKTLACVLALREIAKLLETS